uniref:Endoplasmic reticulum transmembrane protein n=1 Tax=Elphidium margaritaceum TaxID=933848 RepID=A0A7S0XLC7_9EUKA|mmetsp:Transcript_130/g.197  ORF Transcript_130/g.197 Transcript_130/m.197 type:complete len:136 (+) Transcript_130:55-462(+)
MDPGWLAIFVFLMLESVIIGILVMPVPANVVRGVITTTVSRLWSTNSGVRYVAWLMVLINFIYFATTYQAYYYAPQINSVTKWEDCDLKIQRFREQRNLYITGFSIFLFFILRRVLDIQSKLHETKTQLKKLKSS